MQVRILPGVLLICEFCGHETIDLPCQVRCMNCGAIMDCSDYVPKEKPDDGDGASPLGNPKEEQHGTDQRSAEASTDASGEEG